MFRLFKDLCRESQIPRHDCYTKYESDSLRIKAPTALDILKQDALDEAIILKGNSKVLNVMHIGVRAVYAKDEQGGETEIVGYKVIRRELVLRPSLRTTDYGQYLLPVAR